MAWSLMPSAGEPARSAFGMALGADKQKILRLVMRQGMILVSYGLSVGLLLALALTRVLTSSIFEIPILIGVSATDPLTFGSRRCLIVVALLACSSRRGVRRRLIRW